MNDQTAKWQRSPWNAWLYKQGMAFQSSFKSLSANPISSLITLAVLSIALSLPTGFLIALKNGNNLLAGLNDNSRISLFLDTKISQPQLMKLRQQLSHRHDIASINYISPEKGLNEFKERSGLTELLNELDHNPLPPLIEVEAAQSIHTPLQLNQLLKSLERAPHVEFANLDMQWVQRLQGILQLLTRSVYAIAILLALGVLFVIGNSIRLATQNEQQEIAVYKMLGASNAYIRRPFLYIGAMYGVFSAIAAAFIVSLIFWFLKEPLQNLSDSYQSHFHLQGAGLTTWLMLIAFGFFLGCSAAYWIATQQIKKIEAV